MSGQQAALDVTIRDLRLEEYPAVMGLWVEAGLPFRPCGRDKQDRVEAELERGSAVFLVAEAGGRLIGVVLGTNDGRKGWINRLAVAPAYRRRGIARRLVGEVEGRLAAIGIEITAALIETSNTASLAFFKETGYVHGEEIEYVSKRSGADV